MKLYGSLRRTYLCRNALLYLAGVGIMYYSAERWNSGGMGRFDDWFCLHGAHTGGYGHVPSLLSRCENLKDEQAGVFASFHLIFTERGGKIGAGGRWRSRIVQRLKC